jgi:inner membrane protein
MDPLAHTLVGATLAESGLKRVTPLASATLILGANAPDVDFFIGLVDSDYSLHIRRGMTHGVLAMVILPVVLAALMLGFGRWWCRRRDVPPPRFVPLLALAFLSVLTHPALDWLNTYGVRLLMPFDGRWFYGDALFIIDPWVWLLAASAIVVATTRTKVGASAWFVLAAGATALVFGFPGVPWGAQLAWCVGVAALLVLRLTARTRAQRLARAAIVIVGVYASAMVGAGALAARQARDFIEEKTSGDVTFAVANPLPGNPLGREVIVATADSYHFVSVTWTRGREIGETRTPLSRPDFEDPIVRAAFAHPSIRGFRGWMRLPFAQTAHTARGHRVTLYDLRYSRPDDSRFPDFAKVVVELDRRLRPLGQ